MSEQVIAEIKQLFATNEPAGLGPESRSGALPERALNARLDALLPQTKLPPASQQLLRALLLLWHDHLDASHQISQGIENADGSMLHALMHRREPDAWNSKYWWRRVGDHAVFPEFARRVGAHLANAGERALLTQLAPGGEWNPAAFVDACEAAREARDASREAVLREIQRLEMEVLLDYLLAKD